MPDSSSCFALRRMQPESQSGEDPFAADVHRGLTTRPKALKPKYFYDALGSQLFEAICLLPEYYPTRAEAEIFEFHAAEIVAQLPDPIRIVELGSGSSVKTRYLLNAALSRQKALRYEPIDISETILELSAEKLLRDYPSLRITGHVCDYTRGFAIGDREKNEKVMLLFLGSNIGNYTPDEAVPLLRRFRSVLSPGDGLLLGADLKKSAAVLEAAYDDALGVTAAFNLNLLARINRELGADFNLKQFQHRAIYNEDLGRVEIYLVSLADQTVDIADIDLKVDFARGETIHTENSYKYDMAQLAALAHECGFRSDRSWFDTQNRFSCNFWIAVE